MRFFLHDPGQHVPKVGEIVRLGRDETHHLRRVMRARPGDDVRLSDGRGNFYDAILLDGDGCGDGEEPGLRIVRIIADEIEAGVPRLVLACAVVKGRRFEWALEKAVEIGVHEVWPLITERSVIKPRQGRIDRWRSVLRAAVKQSGRSWLPTVTEPVDLDSFLSTCDPADLIYFGDTAGLAAEQGAGIVPDLDRELESIGGSEMSSPPRVVFAVGPEGGWTDDEHRRLEDVGHPVCLGPHRLRTETAAVAGLVFLQAVRCRWRRGAPGGSGGC